MSFVCLSGSMFYGNESLASRRGCSDNKGVITMNRWTEGVAKSDNKGRLYINGSLETRCGMRKGRGGATGAP